MVCFICSSIVHFSKKNHYIWQYLSRESVNLQHNLLNYPQLKSAKLNHSYMTQKDFNRLYKYSTVVNYSFLRFSTYKIFNGMKIMKCQKFTKDFESFPFSFRTLCHISTNVFELQIEQFLVQTPNNDIRNCLYTDFTTLIINEHINFLFVEKEVGLSVVYEIFRLFWSPEINTNNFDRKNSRYEHSVDTVSS